MAGGAPLAEQNEEQHGAAACELALSVDLVQASRSLIHLLIAVDTLPRGASGPPVCPDSLPTSYSTDAGSSKGCSSICTMQQGAARSQVEGPLEDADAAATALHRWNL